MTRSLHWFRKGLRLHDNPALLAACKDAQQVFPVFVIDPHFTVPAKVGKLRYNFLLESLADLDKSLRAQGSRLFVARGNPKTVLPGLFKRFGITKLTFEADSEPYAITRDAEITAAAKKMGIAVESHSSHTLHSLNKYLAKTTKTKGGVPTTYGSFLSVFATMGVVRDWTQPPTTAMLKPDSFQISNSDFSKEFGIPTLEEMGYAPIVLPQKVLYRGGESEGLRRLQKHLEHKDWICKFEKPKTSPNSLEPSTTVLSPYLKFGCVSPRRFYHGLKEVTSTGKSTHPPVSLVGQLLWREFFYLNGAGVANFGKMEGNPICRQIPWGNDESLLAAWKEGKTGYPFIDAIMTQLQNEGWIHHLARHAVACFLTRGDFWQSWEKGVQVFDELLLDADWSLNNGNWMWLSCSAFFHQYFRCYSPVAFGKRTDKTGAYIRHHLPVLKAFPTAYIYEPWKAPMIDQKKANCIIGVDYPKPIVKHEEISKINMAKMKLAFDTSKKPSIKEKVKKEKATTPTPTPTTTTTTPTTTTTTPPPTTTPTSPTPATAAMRKAATVKHEQSASSNDTDTQTRPMKKQKM